jgi:hypothetical protein
VDEFQLISIEPSDRFHTLDPGYSGPGSYPARLQQTKLAPEGGVLLRLGDVLEDTGFWMKRRFPWRQYLHRSDDNRDYTLALDPLTIRRWRLAWGAMKDRPLLLPTSREYVVPSASNVPVFKSANQATAQLMLAFMAAEIVYAGIHAAGWNADFASARLQLAWRAACCVIGGGGVFVAVFGFSWAFADSGKPYWDQTFGAVLVVGALEFAIRMFLLIEALLNVAVLPPGVYQLPQWSTYIPHWA